MNKLTNQGLLQLTKLDLERLKNREDMKKAMHKVARQNNTEPKIVFPRMHIPKDNYQLRYGLPLVIQWILGIPTKSSEAH